MRFILNLKSLNKFVETHHFKLEDLRTALKLISRDVYLAKIDVKDAYFFISIHPEHRKYLRFQWQGNSSSNSKILYQFNVLPFGLSTAPYVFTKVMKPVAKLLRTAGYLSTLYLDDWFLLGNSFTQCLDNIEKTKLLLTALGFIINKEKSCLVPSKSCIFLGYCIDSEKLQVSLPHDKICRIQKEIDKFLGLQRCKIREFAQFIGLLISACPAIEYGWMYTKSIERLKFLSLKPNLDYNAYMNIPDWIKPDLYWWQKAVKTSVCKIKTDTYCLEIFSDASTTGWGAACGEQRASGPWSEQERTYHINYLELLAAFLGLKTFTMNLTNCQVLLRVDNTTALSYINRMGGIQYPHLTEITKQLWQYCESRQLFVFASYISSKDNTLADTESRKLHPDIEWQLSDAGFQQVVTKLGTPEVDLFASRTNKKCVQYISWTRDPDAIAVNAFTVTWSRYFFYAFPPFSVILKSLRKIISDQATGIMVVPMWPTQPWFPLFKKLLVTELIILKPDRNNSFIISPSSSNRQVHTKITLAVGVLSGNQC